MQQKFLMLLRVIEKMEYHEKPEKLSASLNQHPLNKDPCKKRVINISQMPLFQKFNKLCTNKKRIMTLIKNFL